jgi:hypothetical protein
LRDKNAVYNFGSSLAISCTCRLLERVQGRTVSSIYGIGWALITQGSQRCHTCSGFDLGHWCYYHGIPVTFYILFSNFPVIWN